LEPPPRGEALEADDVFETETLVFDAFVRVFSQKSYINDTQRAFKDTHF